MKSVTTAGALLPLTSAALQGCRPAASGDQHRVYDLAVYGATPGGVACAVRAAREGLQVLLISFNDRLGGMLTSGLGVWDTLYEGYRSPIYNELRQAFFDYYKSTYGENSQEYKDALPGESGHNNGTFEAHVAEKYVNEMVRREKNIRALLNHYPVGVQSQDRMITAVELQEMHSSKRLVIAAGYFADCSYEGDLMAVSGVRYRVGRESKEEYRERHAGVIYMRPDGDPVWDARQERIFKKLNIRHFGHHQNTIYPQSTHKGDNKVQAFNMRYYVTDNPENQIEITPSEQYDPEYLKTLEFGVPTGVIKPNGKFGLNRPQLVGMHNAYVEGDWKTRQYVIDEHIRVTRDMIYYIQNDPGAPEKLKKAWTGWGLAKDEYVDNNNDPYEIYVRESRRLTGKYVYTENDLALHADYERSPIHPDSIGIVEWYQDCHACTFEKVPGSLHEGKMMLHKETFPGQLPYRSIVPEEVDNLLVPVCLSATHVAWGAVRLEPTWMQIGESAAFAVIQAMQDGVRLSEIATEKLVRTLAEKRSMVSFFNDFYVDSPESWIPAVQYFGTKGFFTGYDAKPHEHLGSSEAMAWIQGVVQLQSGTHDAVNLATRLSQMEKSDAITRKAFAGMLRKNGLSGMMDQEDDPMDEPLSRAKACEYLYELSTR